MPLTALLAVLLACTHASWNLVAKKASRSTHFIWLYSIASLLIWSGPVIWVLMRTPWHADSKVWLALFGTALLHLAYSLALQAGYRAGDLSLVYPIARGTGPLLSFAGAAWLLGERPGWMALLGVLLVVGGILLVADIGRPRQHSPRAGILWGLLTGACIAAYTLNDGWAVKCRLEADHRCTVYRRRCRLPGVCKLIPKRRLRLLPGIRRAIFMDESTLRIGAHHVDI